jgi:signal transduction histidine kinase
MFRLKIALFSVLISGTILIVFGLYFLSVVSRIQLERLDREILTLGESQLHVHHPREHWQNFGKSLRSIYGEEHQDNLIIQVTGGAGDTLYQSADWPEEITIASFPQFDITKTAPPPQTSQQRDLPPHPGGPPPGMHPSSARPRKPVSIKKPLYQTIEGVSGTWRTVIIGHQYITILIGLNMAGFYEDAARYRTSFFLTIPIALLLMAGGGWWLAQRSLRPVSLITETAEKMTAQGLDQRIPTAKADTEFQRLITVINAMLDRLEKGFQQAVRFSADAAHELQTPLTVLQGLLDDAVRHAQAGSAEQQRSSDLLEEVQRLKAIVRKLLILSRADAGRLELALEPVNMSLLVESIVEDMEIIAPHLRINQRIQAGLTVQADPQLLKQVVHNMTSNAIKYNLPKNGIMYFRLARKKGVVHFRVANTGPMIPVQARKRIFDRFYRVDQSRNDRVPGSGLGLSLALEITRAHKGNLVLDPPKEEGITSFTLSLPQA